MPRRKAGADQAQGLPPLASRVYNVDTVAEHLGAVEQAVLLALVRPQTPLRRRVRPCNPQRSDRLRRHYSVQPTGLRALNQAKAAADRLWSGVRLPLKGVV
jgi:hypothetical protein